MKLILQPNEIILMAGNSRLCEPKKQIHGKLIVTNKRIYFRTLEDACKECNREIVPQEISDLIFFNTKWILPCGMRIITKGGTEHQFIVKNRSEWARLITDMF